MQGSRSVRSIVAVAALALPALVVAQVSMDVRMGTTGGFTASGNGGIIRGVVDYGGTVSVPVSTWTEVGGQGSGRRVVSRTSGGGLGSQSINESGGGTSMGIRVTPVPVDPTGLHPVSLSSATPREVVTALYDPDPSVRAGALRELPRRSWDARQKSLLARHTAHLIGDPVWRVGVLAARCTAALLGPEAAPLVGQYLGWADTDRVVGVLEVIGRIGTTAQLPSVELLERRTDLRVQVAAAEAREAILARAGGKRVAAPAPQAGAPGPGGRR